MRTRILCIGNELVKDDGVALRVGRVLRSLPLPPNVEVDLIPQLGFHLLDVVMGADRLILVDAMSTGRPPGTCITLEGQAIERYSVGASVSHSIGIAELMGLARHLAPERDDATLFFVGIEGESFDGFGITLSPRVAVAIPQAVDAILQILGASDDLRSTGARASTAALANPPSVEEIVAS